MLYGHTGMKPWKGMQRGCRSERWAAKFGASSDMVQVFVNNVARLPVRKEGRTHVEGRCVLPVAAYAPCDSV